jgi:hypothetical protein
MSTVTTTYDHRALGAQAVEHTIFNVFLLLLELFGGQRD